MENDTPLKTAINQTHPRPNVAVPQSNNKKKPKALLIILSFFGVITLSSIVGVSAYMLGKEKGKQEITDNTQTDEDENTTTENTNDTEDIQETDPYEGWRNYYSDEYNFSFKYNSPDPITENTFGGDDPLTLSTSYGENELTWFVVKSNNRSLEEFVDYYTEGNPNIVKTIENYEIGQVDGTLIKFKGYTGELDADYAHIEFYMQGDGDHFHRIRLYCSGEELTEDMEELFTKILESIEI